MIGWIMLSRQAVASAEAALGSDELGVRDEIGFLNLHQTFADRFFPGTSVLHTRLRYALFVPWLMQRAQGDSVKLQKYELELTRQLTNGADKKNGVIGGTILPRAPSQPASVIYWSALTRWKLLRPRADDVSLSRSETLRQIAAAAKSAHGHVLSDEGEPAVLPELSPFVRLPDPPAEFLKTDEPIAFLVTPVERTFLRRQLIGVGKASGPSTVSLLARLADVGLPSGSIDTPWRKAILKVADADDRHALMIARRAAAVAGVGRSIYAALLEAAKASDGLATTTRHRDHLKNCIAELSAEAQLLEISELRALFPAIPGYLDDVITRTQAWLKANPSKVSTLYDVYSRAESLRKGARARLPNTAGGRGRREEWNGDKHPLGGALHFRWPTVLRLLADLRKP